MSNLVDLEKRQLCAQDRRIAASRVSETLTRIDLPANSGFKDFYRDMFEPQVKKAERRAEFTESAWDMNWCDPDAADPLFFEELRSLGVSWLNRTPPDFIPGRGRRPIMPPMGGARDVFATPMKVRNDDQHFPDEMIMNPANAGNGRRWQYSRPEYPAAA